MATSKGKKQLDQSTEEKIKAAARKVFHQKGYAATRTRDIAEESGINLALISYYFKSKENLYEIITLETVFKFMHNLAVVFHDESSSFDEKIEQLADRYIDFISKEPDIPLFILTAMRNNPVKFGDKIPLKTIVLESIFYQQFQEKLQEGNHADISPLQYLLNLVSLIIFPFVAKPVFQNITSTKDSQFHKMMQERKKLIPIWIKGMYSKS